MNIILNVNGVGHEIQISPGESLMTALRRLGYFSVKHGCETGECGACTVLVDSKPVNSCVFLAAQAVGHRLETVETLGEVAEQGWKTTEGLHPLQKAFVESGAIQCGYCTPAMLLAASELLRQNQNPSEAEVRQALSGVLCRCTGYVKPVQAVLRTAAFLRGETVEPLEGPIPAPQEWLPKGTGEPPAETGPEALPPLGAPVGSDLLARTRLMPRMQVTPETSAWQSVGKPEKKVDAVKLVQGKPAFTADFDKRDLLGKA